MLSQRNHLSSNVEIPGDAAKLPQLLITSIETFELSHGLVSSDPKTAAQLEIDGHELLASFYMANGNESYVEELRTAVRLKLDYIRQCSGELSTEDQNNYVFMALAAREQELARKVAAIEADYDNSHKFSVLFNCKLKKLVGVLVLVKEPAYKPSKSEAGLFAALDSVVNNEDVDWPLLHKYWNTLKSRRYKATVFEHRDLFTDAIRYARQFI